MSTSRNVKSGPPAVVAKPARIDRVMPGGVDLVRVDALYHVPDVHPTAEGPWSVEADKVAWTDPTTGLGCIIRRSPNGGHLCGYVSVPRGHPLHGRHVATLHAYSIAVHGGLDHSAECEEDEREDRSVCHVVANDFVRRVHTDEGADRDDAWWLGFSCDKRQDVLPEPHHAGRRDVPRIGVDEPTYKTEAYVHRECARLAAQLKAIGDGGSALDADPGPTRLGLLPSERAR